MMEPKFKVGDKVVITGNSHGHGFNIGETVVVIEVDTTDSDYRCHGEGVHDFWYCAENDIEPVSDSPSSYDPVSKPSHYNQDGGIECIDYIKQVLGKEGFVAYCRGNQIKYQHRAMYKGNAVQDLEKAGQYNAWAIETLKGMNDD